jgi:hypothetical protein
MIEEPVGKLIHICHEATNIQNWPLRQTQKGEQQLGFQRILNRDGY